MSNRYARRPWSGGQNIGSRDFTAQERANVLAALKSHIGRRNRISHEALASKLLMDGKGRKLRAILSDLDGNEVLLVGRIGGNGDLWIAEYREEAERTTRTMRSTARKLQERADRRDKLAAETPLLQGQLFDEEEEDDEDFEL